MNRDEFIHRWLVVGTESKATTDTTPLQDRNGLPTRLRQGQKGIGRLSCANLGPILLLISKRRSDEFVIALVDWRLFENPFINLSDVQIPVSESANKENLLDLVPSLVERLRENVCGGGESGRTGRIKSAWRDYDAIYDKEAKEGTSNKICSPSAAIFAISVYFVF